ncbi:hypothetical protein LAWI1_G002476 [Lachnellula willkommii]|uniref:Uncharacterized protein n=1 Tax=Lachnellula willkommii TaxID=215461 RepID=A0A559MKW5_9HELO|nr:hypothetical protein LAWI1_G002476 [Lachnellula willkommii]
MELPQLPYTLQTRKRSITITWSALIVVTSVQVEFFYFLLRYGTKSGIDNALTVPTAILLGLSILSMGFRTWRLLRPSFQQTPSGGRWYGLDFFSWNMIVGFVIVTAVLSVATSEKPVNIRQASMPQAIILYLASSQLLVTGLMTAMGLKTPVRFSSTTRGSLMKPGIFVLIEDIVGVDGGGGPEFRNALVARYESSITFRRLVAQMNWFWGIGSMIVAGGTTVIVYIIEDLNVVFALGRHYPFDNLQRMLTESQAGVSHGYGLELVLYAQFCGLREC